MLGWELPPHNSGGLGVACLQMSKALAMQGASIDFVVPYEAEHPEATFMTIVPAIRKAPATQYGLSAYDTHFIDKNHPDEGMRAVQRQYIGAVERLVESSDSVYDAIHAHDWLTVEAGMRAKELTNAPLIVHVHATEFDRAGDRYGNPLIHEIEEQGLMMADRIIAVSNITKQLIVSRYKIPADKVEVMHNALDVDALLGYEYDLRTYRYLEHLKEQGYTVVANVARFTVQKGLDQFLAAAARACERYDKIIFLLVGDGEMRDELIRRSAELGIADKVFFTGFIRGKVWRDAFSVADVFVMSSVSEPFGITALEAAHHNDTVILTKQSGVGEVLRNVYRYDFWDVDALADRLVALASSSALQTTMRENLAYEYTHITWHNVARRCLELYRNLSTQGAVL